MSLDLLQGAKPLRKVKAADIHDSSIALKGIDPMFEEAQVCVCVCFRLPSLIFTMIFPSETHIRVQF